MKNMVNKLKLLLLIGMLTMPVILMAQDPFEEDVPDVPVPFDGGVSLLVAAGIAYGLKKVHDSKKKAEKEEVL